MKTQTPTVHPVTRRRWPDLVQLFERPGPRGGQPATGACWCMFWRISPKEFSVGWGRADGRGRGNKRAVKQLIDRGSVPGLLAYIGGEPVGWVSLGPRSAFPRLQRSCELSPIDDNPVWSVVCFYIDPRHRKSGVSPALLEAAVEYARQRGARLLEGYGSKPRDLDPFSGHASTFRAGGFEVVRQGRRRSIMRRKVRAR